MHLGGPAPGMNTAVRAAVRIGLDQGHALLAVRNGLNGLLAGQIREMGWMDVHGRVRRGGAELGTSRRLPTELEWEQIAAILEQQRIDGILMIGGWVGYEFAYELGQRRSQYPALAIPVVCLPATINNDLPGTEMTIGADTALNTIVTNVDKVKESAVASHRVYVVEVMGRDSGYLAMMSGLATGAERVYLPEDGITLAELQRDVAGLRAGFEGGKRLGLMIRNEKADPYYTTGFLVTLFEKEGGDLFDVRQTILGHIQQGGSPTPYDRIQATRLATRAQLRLIEQASNGGAEVQCIGRLYGKITFTDLANLPDLVEAGVHRPRVEEWLALKDVARLMAVYAPRA
jgi:6-phosphofructokinase 1